MTNLSRFLKWSGKKAVVFFVLTLTLAVATVGSTLAYIIVRTTSVENQFTAPKIDVELVGNEVSNEGDVPVYVRAAVVATWVHKTDGTTLSIAPTVTVTQNSGWVQGSDGFYYRSALLNVEESSAPIESVSTTDTAPEGYKLNVLVLTEAIQAMPAEAVTNSWSAVTGIDANGNLNVN